VKRGQKADGGTIPIAYKGEIPGIGTKIIAYGKIKLDKERL
jgi:hypothetical protein